MTKMDKTANKRSGKEEGVEHGFIDESTVEAQWKIAGGPDVKSVGFQCEPVLMCAKPKKAPPPSASPSESAAP